MDDDLLATIGAVYETALNNGRWPAALDRVAWVTGGHGAILMVRGGGPAELGIDAMSTRYRMPRASEYLAQLRTGSEPRWLEALAAAPAGTILADEEVWPDRSEYDALPTVDFLRRFGLYHRCAARVSGHGGWEDVVAVLYGEDRQGVRPQERQALTRVLPHLARAVETQRPFLLLERRYQQVLGTLDRLGMGVLILSADADVLVSNREAERIVDLDDGIARDARGRLRLTAEPRRLEETVAAAARTAGLRSQEQGRSLAVPRPSGRDDLMLDVVPLRDDDLLGRRFSGALILLVDPDHRAMVSISGLAVSYGLTEAETAVCALIADGLTGAEIAEQRGVTPGTVKSQTSTIFGKTRTRNRAELIRRALSIVPPLVDAEGRREN